MHSCFRFAIRARPRRFALLARPFACGRMYHLLKLLFKLSNSFQLFSSPTSQPANQPASQSINQPVSKPANQPPELALASDLLSPRQPSNPSYSKAGALQSSLSFPLWSSPSTSAPNSRRTPRHLRGRAPCRPPRLPRLHQTWVRCWGRSILCEPTRRATPPNSRHSRAATQLRTSSPHLVEAAPA